ncbi:nucleoid-associated protein YgaU [Duganella sp. 1411]|uniref:CIS tube protein n=1 Tax=Duganella sp. 1411 TaxID=2806572 RepID=UPI001AE85B99|nr:nucleoid-associated protein YgaU [Duganella sp. 1411]
MSEPAKAIFRVYWHGRGQPEDIPVQYNPSEYTLDKQVQIAEVQIPGLDAPLQQFVRGQAEKLTLDLFFDTTEHGMGAGATSVTTETDKIYQLIKIEPTRHAPPILEFIWSDQMAGTHIGGAPGSVAAAAAKAVSGAAQAAGSAVGAALGAAGSIGAAAQAVVGPPLGSQRRNGFRCLLDSVKQKFTLFSPEGVPLRATLTVSLREYKRLRDQLLELHLSSPDRTHVHALQQGEQLASVAQRYYDSPVDWRAIAGHNAIDDPRRLVPGRLLTVPPLD